MAYAAIENSPRLQATRAALRRGSLTSIELVEQAHVTNPGEAVSELNAQGYVIDCVFEGVSASRRRIFRYSLKSEPNQMVCPGDDCDELIAIINGKGWCPNHQMEITIR